MGEGRLFRDGEIKESVQAYARIPSYFPCSVALPKIALSEILSWQRIDSERGLPCNLVDVLYELFLRNATVLGEHCPRVGTQDGPFHVP